MTNIVENWRQVCKSRAKQWKSDKFPFRNELNGKTLSIFQKYFTERDGLLEILMPNETTMKSGSGILDTR